MLESWLIAWWVLLLALGWYPCCCGEEEWDCDLNCQANTTPNYLSITFTGLAAGSYGCDCQAINDTYLVPHRGTDECRWYARYDDWQCKADDPEEDYYEIDSYLLRENNKTHWYVRLNIQADSARVGRSILWKWTAPDSDLIDCSDTYYPPFESDAYITDLCNPEDEITCRIN